jgi:hypothetical protein
MQKTAFDKTKMGEKPSKTSMKQVISRPPEFLLNRRNLEILTTQNIFGMIIGQNNKSS